MRHISVIYGQSLFDICVQEFGSVEALPVVAALNNLEFDHDLVAGQILSLPDLEAGNEIQGYFSNQAIKVNSHIKETLADVLATNDNEAITDNNKNGIHV